MIWLIVSAALTSTKLPNLPPFRWLGKYPNEVISDHDPLVSYCEALSRRGVYTCHLKITKLGGLNVQIAAALLNRKRQLFNITIIFQGVTTSKILERAKLTWGKPSDGKSTWLFREGSLNVDRAYPQLSYTNTFVPEFPPIN